MSTAAVTGHATTTDTEAFLAAIHADENVFEVRAPNAPETKVKTWRSTWSGYADNAADGARIAMRIDTQSEPAGVYATVNPCRPELLARRANRMEFKARQTTTDAEIDRLRWIPVDVDSLRPSGISATDDEVAAAGQVVERIVIELANMGWPEPIRVMTGNGWQLHVPIDMENNADNADLVHRVLQGLAERFDTEGAKVDLTTANPSRIVKVPGTWARKGDSLPDRPHRQCYAIIPPDPRGQVVTREQLEQVAKPKPEPRPVARQAATSAKTKRNSVTAVEDLKIHAEGREEELLLAAGYTPEQLNGRHQPCPRCDGKDRFRYDRASKFVICNQCFRQGNGDWLAAVQWIRGDDNYKDTIAWVADYLGIAGGGRAKPKQAQAKPQEPQGEVTEADDDPIRLARVIGSRVTTYYWQEDYYVFDGMKYVRHSEAEFQDAQGVPIVKAEFDYLHRAAVANSPDEPPPHPRKTTPRIVADACRMYRSQVAVPSSVDMPAYFPDGDPKRAERRNYLPVANGLVDLEAAIDQRDCLMPSTPHYFSTVGLPYAYDPHAECPRWAEFVRQVTQDDIDTMEHLQQWAGYLLTPDTSQHAFLCLEGTGGNGKSVFLAGLEAIIGSDNVSSCHLEAFGDRFGLWPMVGKRANFSRDVGNVVPNEHVIKSVVTGESITIDRKRMAPVTTRLEIKLVMAWNERPRFRDRSDGIWRRMHLVPFRHTVPDDQRILGMDDPAYWLEQGELPGMLNWAIRGLRKLRRHGWTISQASRDAVANMKREANPAREFVEDHYCYAEGYHVPRSEVYAEYRAWCERSGYKPIHANKFASEVLAAFPNVAKARPRIDGGRSRVYEHLAARQHADWAT